MKVNKIVGIMTFIFLLCLPLAGCKPSQEDFFELKKKQLELEQRVKTLEEENSKLKESIENFNPLKKFFENITKPHSSSEYSNQPLPEFSGELLELEPFIVNLADPGTKRYMKLKLAIELDSKELLTKAKQLTPKFRDQVILILTKLSVDDVMTPESKMKLRDELVEKINDIFQPAKISNLYFTELVVQ
ncbi:MAG: flagellar basal body-associated FliL family protein [Desulfobulbaceae bacterium]|nr:flagellar basal body-associated FliL family protein [Desulfobulbaceae bacterium]